MWILKHVWHFELVKDLHDAQTTTEASVAKADACLFLIIELTERYAPGITAATDDFCPVPSHTEARTDGGHHARQHPTPLDFTNDAIYNRLARKIM